MGRKSRNRSRQRLTPPVPTGGSPPPSRSTATPEADPRSRALAGGACGAVLLFVLVTVWAAPRLSGDTFVALAGGRDVLQGRLGKPDDWSFTTSGRVWLNQNWGFDAIAYAVARVAGEGGLLALKAVMLIGIAVALAAASRARGAPWPGTILVTAAVLAGVRWHVELRANLATYLMLVILLLVIYGSVSRPRLIWLAVPVIAAWADLHGGFMLGFALLGLWTAASAIAALRTTGISAALRGSAGPAAALAASVLASGLLSPFGIANVTYPFTYVSSPEWRAVTEWQPVSLTALHGPGTAWEFELVLAAVVGGAGWRWLRGRHAHEGRRSDREGSSTLVLFDAGLVIVMAAMAFSAIRFVPVALLGVAPLAAFQAELLVRGRRPWIVPAVGAGAVAISMAPFAGWVAARYGRDNPRFTDETFFQRMLSADRMPSGAAQFLLDNGGTGRVYNDWRWEGFLRWRCPKLQLFIGGRATQMYTLDTLHAYEQIASDPRPEAALATWDTHLVVVPGESTYLELAYRLAFTDDARWAPVFYDGRSLVLADLKAPNTRALVSAVAAGAAHFREARVAALSEALCRVSAAVGPDGPQAVADLVEANLALPTAGGASFLSFTARERHLQPQWLVRTLEGEYEALSRESAGAGRRLGTLEARLSIAQILTRLYRAAGARPQSEQWAATVGRLTPELESLLNAT